MKCWVASILRLVEVLARAHFRQASRLLVVGGIVLALLIEREEAVELDHRAGRAQIDGSIALAGPPTLAVMSAVVRSSSADSIWLAIVRSQISS